MSRQAEAAAYNRVYREKNREQLKAKVAARYRANKAAGHIRALTPIESQAARERALARYAAKPEAIKAYVKSYRSKNPEKTRAWSEAYRARRLHGAGVTAAEWLAVLNRYGWACLACGSAKRITMDHVIPLAVGGRHEPANVQPLCHPCNCRKSTKVIDYRPAEVMV